MKASVNWIKEFVAVDASAREIADRLTLAGLEVEGFKDQGAGLEKVVTATLLKVEKHPHADRLTVCEVKSGEQIHTVVCGAKNHKAGDRIALALPGATLPNGMAIGETVIRKVKSAGMLCSEKELGLATESEGILILSPEIPEGKALAEALGLDDVLLEINVTPNRGDCLSMQGLAREVAAAFGTEAVLNKGAHQSSGTDKFRDILVALQAPELCPRYTCRSVRNVKVAASPPWVQRRLESCGVRPINNVVDATNYVMLETGQPLHAFDLRRIHGGQIIVRTAREGEMLETLDAKSRPLQAGDLVIADADRVLALAGVMGGADSGVEENTSDLLLESAYFSPETVRKTAKRLGLQTESSYRFERGIDPLGCLRALDRLAQLIQEWAGGQASQDYRDACPEPIVPLKIPLRRRTLERVLGYEFPLDAIFKPLGALGITALRQSPEEALFEVPPRRSDITREIDLVEEAARLYGYHRIPTRYPSLSLEQIPPPADFPMDRIRDLLRDWGFSEVLHYSFGAPPLFQRFGHKADQELQLLNPLSEEMSLLRPSLLPQMVETLKNNIYRGAKNLRFFELRPVYRPDPAKQPPFQEDWRLCLGLSGNRRDLHFSEKEEALSLLDLKGYVTGLIDAFADRLSPSPLVEEGLQRPYFHPRRQALLKGMAIEMGEIHPAWLEEWGIRVAMAVAEIPLDLFLTGRKNQVQFKKVPSFPSVWRDINLVVEEATTHRQIEAVFKEHGGPWVKRFVLFDLYRGKPLPEGKKSLTYTVEYATEDRTLTDDEVNQSREGLLMQLKKEIGATLR